MNPTNKMFFRSKTTLTGNEKTVKNKRDKNLKKDLESILNFRVIVAITQLYNHHESKKIFFNFE